MSLTKKIAVLFSLYQGIILRKSDKDRFKTRLIMLLILLIWNITLAIIVYVFIHDHGRTNERTLNHFIYPQASFQIVYCIMLLAALIYPMTTMTHMYSVFMCVLTFICSIFQFANGVTPAFGVTLLFEFFGQLFLELVFISNCIVINRSKKAQEAKKAVEEFKDHVRQYREDNVGEQAEVNLFGNNHQFNIVESHNRQ